MFMYALTIVLVDIFLRFG